MNKTIFLGSDKVDEDTFFIDVLYFSGTSYRKSLYPTIERYFKKYAKELMCGGTFHSTSTNISESGSYAGLIETGIYKIRRTIYTRT